MSGRQAAALGVAPWLALTLVAAGCHSHSEHEHPVPAAEVEPIVITHFNDHSELFVEFPPLVRGQDSRFAVHLTQLEDFRPVTAGRVRVLLSGGGSAEERFEVDAPRAPGIFGPVARPVVAGKRELSIVLEREGREDRHELGAVEVHGAADQVAPPAPEPDGGAGRISFLKEQQWKTDFATAPVAEARLRAWVDASGTLRPRPGGESGVRAPAGGRVALAGAALPEPGARVAAGQALLALDRFLGQGADLPSLEQARERARIAHELARRERERLERLLAAEAVPERRVSAARDEERAAAVDLEAAERRLGQHLGVPGTGGAAAADRLLLRAPTSGTVVEMKGVAGASVREGDELVRIVDLSLLWLEARVAEADVGRITAANLASFRVQGIERDFEVGGDGGGRLVTIGGVLDPVTRTLPLLFEVPNPDGALRAGLAAKVRVATGASVAAVAILAASVVEDGGRPVAYVQIDGEAFERRPLELGIRDGDRVEVKAGLVPGERVVTRGAYEVRLAASSTTLPAHGHVH